MGLFKRDELGEELDLLQRCLKASVPDPLAATLREATATVWVASGLSRAAAEVGRSMVVAATGRPALVVAPQQSNLCPLAPSVPVLVTYRGRNRDAQKVATTLASSKGGPVMVLTGAVVSPTLEILSRSGRTVHVLTLPQHRTEGAFVGVRAFVGLSALATRLALGLGNVARADALHDQLPHLIDTAKSAADALASKITALSGWQSRTWTILTSGFAEPVHAAYQSLLAESGLAMVSWFDVGDYTHGNYHAAVGASARAMILVLTDATTKTAGMLIERRLGPYVPVFNLSLGETPEETIWSHVLSAVFLTKVLARTAGVSLRHPHRPTAARTWKRWDLK